MAITAAVGIDTAVSDAGKEDNDMGSLGWFICGLLAGLAIGEYYNRFRVDKIRVEIIQRLTGHGQQKKSTDGWETIYAQPKRRQ